MAQITAATALPRPRQGLLQPSPHRPQATVPAP